MLRILIISCILIVSCTSQNNSTEKSEDHQIFLVRHAEKADDGTKDPPLTEEGEMRAKNLATMLADKEIKKIYSSDYKRTRLTAQPLAQLLNLDVLIYDPVDTSFYSKIRTEAMTQNLLIVGHSNTTPNLTNSIIGSQKYKQLDESVYDQLFIIEAKNKKYKSRTESF